MIFAGKLRHRVIVQQLTTGSPQQTATGAPDEFWVSYCTEYASIEPLIGQEFLAADQIQSKVDTRIRMRYAVGVNDEIVAGMRIKFGTTIYNIDTPINVEMRNKEWVLMCSTGLNQG